jgi:hypothetical protein
MSFIKRIKHDLRAGWATLRYGTAQAARRALEETEVLRLRLEIRKLDGRIQERCRDIGERALTLHERHEPIERIMGDLDITQAVRDVAALKQDRRKLESEIEDVRSGE